MSKKTLGVFFILVCSFFSAYSSADDYYWQCMSEDSTNKRWLGFALFERTARQKALDECKKNSIYPRSCIEALEPCLAPFSYQGRPEGVWVCTALDRNGSPWVNAGKADKVSAALAAKAFCKAKSTIPHTCYINTVTCKERGLSY